MKIIPRRSIPELPEGLQMMHAALQLARFSSLKPLDFCCTSSRANCVAGASQALRAICQNIPAEAARQNHSYKKPIHV